MLFRRLVSIVALVATLAMPAAYALTGSRDLLLGGNPFSWVATNAATELDFANNRYFNCSLSSCLSLARASSKTNLLPSSASGFAFSTFGSGVLSITPGLGLLIEESRVNQLFNSCNGTTYPVQCAGNTGPATQTTGSLATGTYTLWVNGSGSAAMSSGTATGCGAGTAVQGVQVNFTITVAGTCTVTVSGSLFAFQLELGASGTSLIVTAGATATRAADNITAAGFLISNLQTSTGMSVMATTTLVTGAPNARVLGTTTNSGELYLNNSTSVGTYNGSGVIAANIGIGSWTGILKSAVSFTSASRLLVAGNGTVVSDGAMGTDNIHPYKLGSQAGTLTFIDGYISNFAVWNTALPSAALAALTQSVIGSGGCPQSRTLFTRTTASHAAGDNLDQFVCGMVTDGTFSVLDHLWVAQANATDTLLNIAQSNAMTVSGFPTFTANSGYTGTSGALLNPGINASTAGGNYAQNSSSAFVLDMTAFVASTDYGAAFGQTTTSATSVANIYPHYSNNNFYFFAQTTTSFSVTGASNNFYGWARTSSGGANIIQEPGVSSVQALASTTLANDTFSYLGGNNAGALSYYTGKLGGGGFGGGLSSIQLKQVCQRFETYAAVQLGLAAFSCAN